MGFRLVHANRNVADLTASVQFYSEALGFREVRRKEAEDGSFVLVFLEAEPGGFQLELTWLRDWKGAYDLGDNEIHLAVMTPSFEAAHELHSQMGCICYENTDMGVYFVNDPDGYWIEVIPAK
ncbi:MAG: VOC family protein [Oscillospiraceae bacterium]|nr:VOC family protein [Oscillospiraceae bacterium]